jgi:pilus assembly protein CpaB
LAADLDIALADERDGGGLALDGDLAEGIPLVGFGDDGLDDVDLIGFDSGAAPGDIGPTVRPRQSGALSAVWSAALAALQRQAFRLTASHLGVRRLRSAIVPAVAVLAAVGVGFAVRSWLPPPQPKQVVAAPPASSPTVDSVVVARRPIHRGQLLHASDLEWRRWPPADIKPAYFRPATRGLADLRGYVARARIAEGQPVKAGDIAAPAGGGFMAAMLKPGMRAISVAIGPETAASGLILPGDAVDVLLSMPVPAFDANGEIAAEERGSVVTLLRNIRVLAIDRETDGEPYRSIIGHTATLEVTPKEAEIVTLANELAQRGGMLVLALRSIRGEAGTAGAAAPSHLLDTDVSKLLTDRPVDAPDRPAGLTIVRRATLSQLSQP